jgi:hypothetical protein
MANPNYAISHYWIFVAGSQSQYWRHAGDASANQGYDIFRELADVRSLWTAEAATLAEAKQMLENLAGVMPAEYFASNVATGEIVARIPDDGSEGLSSQSTRPRTPHVK